MDVVLAGTYVADFRRNRQIRRLLELGGHRIREVHVDLWPPDRVAVVQAPKGRLLLRAVPAYLRLLGKLIAMRRPDVVVVGYPGWFDVPLVAAVCRLRRIPVLFDMFISIFETAVVDRRLLTDHGVAGRLTRLADQLASRTAHRVLLDTAPHADYVADLTRVRREKFGVLPLGADEAVFFPRPSEVDVRRVTFHGTFVPLQGLPTIVRAAALLRDPGVEFVLIGDGQDSDRVEELIRDLGVDNVVRTGLLPVEDLPDYLAGSACILGVFGTSEKANLVVPNKVYEGIAMGRPVITAATDAISWAFESDEIEVVPVGDPEALAASIRRLIGDEERRERLAGEGRRAFETRFSEGHLAELLTSEMRTIVSL